MGVQGDVDEGWGAVRDAFAANFDERGEVGAAVSVHLEGRPGYVMNDLRFDVTGDPRSETLVRAARAAAGGS